MEVEKAIWDTHGKGSSARLRYSSADGMGSNASSACRDPHNNFLAYCSIVLILRPRSKEQAVGDDVIVNLLFNDTTIGDELCIAFCK